MHIFKMKFFGMLCLLQYTYLIKSNCILVTLCRLEHLVAIVYFLYLLFCFPHKRIHLNFNIHSYVCVLMCVYTYTLTLKILSYNYFILFFENYKCNMSFFPIERNLSGDKFSFFPIKK